MKKSLLLVPLLCAIMLTACGNGWAHILGTYPRIEYLHSDYEFDQKNRIIDVFDGYAIDPEKPYEYMKTDDGYVLIIYFVEEEAETT